MSQNKKPTMMQMKNVVSNIINHVNSLEQAVSKIDIVVNQYIKFKGDGTEFGVWIKNALKEAQENQEEVYSNYDKGDE